MCDAWSLSKLDHAIACAERSRDGRAHTKNGSYTLETLRRARPLTFPLAPFTTLKDYSSLLALRTAKK